MSEQTVSKFYRKYDLIQARKHGSKKEPAAHQTAALSKVKQWFTDNPTAAGGILVLPTGGGKTFTAVRFLCTGPLSQGYKVLWLAHTHHLLEQALESFGPGRESIEQHSGYEVANIAEPKNSLHARVISGTPGHWPVKSIETDDDVLICTLQTITRAYFQEHPAIKNWLESTQGKLFVVFDEAHHSPAPSYRKFVLALRESYPKMSLLGLTATPTYTDEKRQGWLKRIFPQGIVYQAKTQDLMADNILAQPIVEQYETEFTPDFDEREYQKWVGSYRDLPEEMITKLAQSRERNMMIASTYAENKERYGKTLMFADRWFQCDRIREFLHHRGVRADVIYTHIDAKSGNVEARNKRTRDTNANVLKAFRENNLDVLINVRMLTEGTDIPDAQTVFLTRQTTSSILLTQMIGRALRGSRFGGTKEAYIVAFIDNWKHLINWAEYEQIKEGLIEETEVERGKRPPLQLISIELVRQLNRQMDSGLNVALKPFLSLMPIGWYLVKFTTLVEGSDDLEEVNQMVMVYDSEEEAYHDFIEHLKTASIHDFSYEDLTIDNQTAIVQAWAEQFFGNIDNHIGEEKDFLFNLFHIARHMAQDEDRKPPLFFSFEERNYHNMDRIAHYAIDQDLSVNQIKQMLQAEYRRTDRYWHIMYPNYGLFKSQFDACMNRLEEVSSEEVQGIGDFVSGEDFHRDEPSEQVKQQVKQRDGYTCLCCGETRRYSLQIDHVAPAFYGGTNSLDNLQTLCRFCNNHKGINQINFRYHSTILSNAPQQLPKLALPSQQEAHDLASWDRYLRRLINFFYRCAAVEVVTIKGRGEYFYNWHISLYQGNDPQWLKPFLPDVLFGIQSVRRAIDRRGPEHITLQAPDLMDIEVG
jgi:superfamily II DNA or RNA helicase